MTERSWRWSPMVATVLLAAGCVASISPDPRPSEEPARSASPQPPVGWATDFTRLAPGVSLDQFVRALGARDLIPPIDDPRYVSAVGVDFLADVEPVIAVEVDGAWRAYPIQILIWHEIVNDTLGGHPITVTFCPLCYTGVVFDRRVADRTLDFGVTGYLRRSDLVMWDRQTETWWQQANGWALVGELAGELLTVIPSQIHPWAAFRDAHPDGEVLSRDTGYVREYGMNPYPGWDDTVRNPFLGGDQLEPCEGAAGCIDPKERVGVLVGAEETVIYRFIDLSAAGGVAHDVAGAIPVVVWWLPDVASALDMEVLERGDQLGTLVAFDRRLGDDVLAFDLRDGLLVDRRSGSHWNPFGQAVDGPLAGERLTALPMDTPYWFAAAAFATDTRVWAP